MFETVNAILVKTGDALLRWSILQHIIEDDWTVEEVAEFYHIYNRYSDGTHQIPIELYELAMLV